VIFRFFVILNVTCIFSVCIRS